MNLRNFLKNIRSIRSIRNVRSLRKGRSERRRIIKNERVIGRSG
jgi:hypothetical protein